MRFRQKSDKHFRPPQRENGNPKAAKPTASLAGPGPPCTAPRAAQVTGRLRPRAHGCFDHPAPGAHTPLRPSGRLCGHHTSDLTSPAAAAPHAPPGALWSFRPASPSQTTADRRRTARAGLRGRSRRSGVPGTESHDTGPGSSTDGRWQRHGARPPSRGSFYSGARVRPRGGGGIQLPSRSGNQWPVEVWSLEMHKHTGQQHGLQCKEIAFFGHVEYLNEWQALLSGSYSRRRFQIPVKHE